MPQEPIDLYIDNLLKQANLNLPEDFKEPYKEKIKDQINQRLGMIIMENLDEDGLKEFSQLMAAEPQPNIVKIQQSFQARIPDFDQKIRAAMIDFAQDFIKAASKQPA